MRCEQKREIDLSIEEMSTLSELQAERVKQLEDEQRKLLDELKATGNVNIDSESLTPEPKYIEGDSVT